MQFYLISALVFSLLVAVFAIQNTEVVVVKFLTFQFPISLVLVILGSAVVGALALYSLSVVKQLGSWFKIRQLNHRKADLEKQVKELEEKVTTLEINENEEQEVTEESNTSIVVKDDDNENKNESEKEV